MPTKPMLSLKEIYHPRELARARILTAQKARNSKVEF